MVLEVFSNLVFYDFRILFFKLCEISTVLQFCNVLVGNCTHLSGFSIRFCTTDKIWNRLAFRVFSLFFYMLINFIVFFSFASSCNFHKNIVDIFGDN